MKSKITILFSLLCASIALAQTEASNAAQTSSGPMQSYTAIDGHTYHLGDTITLGIPAVDGKGLNHDFKSVYIDAGSEKKYFKENQSGKAVVVRFFRMSSTGICILFKGESGSVNSFLEVDKALRLGEMKSANLGFNYKTYVPPVRRKLSNQAEAPSIELANPLNEAKIKNIPQLDNRDTLRTIRGKHPLIESDAPPLKVE